MLIQIKNRFSGLVIFEHDCEKNTIKLTLKKAIKAKTNLRSADLRSADLRSANFRECVGDMKFVFSLQLDNWMVVFTKDILWIGCQRHAISDWLLFDDERIESMDSKALAFWRKWKDFILKAIELSIPKVEE